MFLNTYTIINNFITICTAIFIFIQWWFAYSSYYAPIFNIYIYIQRDIYMYRFFPLLCPQPREGLSTTLHEMPKWQHAHEFGCTTGCTVKNLNLQTVRELGRKQLKVGMPNCAGWKLKTTGGLRARRNHPKDGVPNCAGESSDEAMQLILSSKGSHHQSFSLTHVWAKRRQVVNPRPRHQIPCKPNSYCGRNCSCRQQHKEGHYLYRPKQYKHKSWGLHWLA